MAETATGRREVPERFPAIDLTINALGPNDPIAKISEIAKRYPAIRLEAGITAGQATWSGRRTMGDDRQTPSFERLREMIAECRVNGIGAAVHLEDCYADMAENEEHRIIRGLAEGADRIQVEDTGYDYDAIDRLRVSVELPTAVRNWNGFAGETPSTGLEYLYTDLGQPLEAAAGYPRPWPNVRCGYAGKAVNADPGDAVKHMLNIGNDRGWLEIERGTITNDTNEIDTGKLEMVLSTASRAAVAVRQDRLTTWSDRETPEQLARGAREK